MALPNSSTAPLPAEYAGDEVSAIILDPGYSTTRAGFAGEDCPKSVVPTYYGVVPSKSTEYFFGENAIHNPIPELEIKNPWGSDGVVEDWDVASKLWEYSITSRLTGQKPTSPSKNGLNDPQEDGMEVDENGADDAEKPLAEAPLLMTEPGWNSVKSREKYIEIAMEDWGVPAFWLGRTGVLAAFASGKATALVIDVGASITSVTPVIDGIMMKKGVQKSSLAGNYISGQIRQIFQQASSPVPLTPHYMVQSKTPVEAGAPSQAIYRKFEVPPTESFRRLQEERVLTEFKESVVQVWTGPGRFNSGNNEDLAKAQPPRPFEMPDGWNQVFGAERYKAAEALFDAKAALSDSEKPKETETIPGMVLAALNNVDTDQRPNLLGNIVITGATSLLYGFNERLNNEISAVYPAMRVRLHAPGNTVERKYAAWVGGSILGSLGTFHQMWISKKEYDEHGAGIVEKRCK